MAVLARLLPWNSTAVDLSLEGQRLISSAGLEAVLEGICAAKETTSLRRLNLKQPWLGPQFTPLNRVPGVSLTRVAETLSKQRLEAEWPSSCDVRAGPRCPRSTVP